MRAPTFPKCRAKDETTCRVHGPAIRRELLAEKKMKEAVANLQFKGDEISSYLGLPLEWTKPLIAELTKAEAQGLLLQLAPLLKPVDDWDGLAAVDRELSDGDDAPGLLIQYTAEPQARNGLTAVDFMADMVKDLPDTFLRKMLLVGIHRMNREASVTDK